MYCASLVRSFSFLQVQGDRKRRPRVQTQVNGTPIEALVDSGVSVSVMSKKAFKTVWEHWNMQRLPIPAALTVFKE
jgi:hypothetical protein